MAYTLTLSNAKITDTGLYKQLTLSNFCPFELQQQCSTSTFTASLNSKDEKVLTSYYYLLYFG
jgi:hypothetical protein